MTSAITGTGSVAPARAFDWRSLIKQRYLIIAIAFIAVAFVTTGGSSYSTHGPGEFEVYAAVMT